MPSRAGDGVDIGGTFTDNAGGLLVRTHTLNKDQDRPSGLTTSGEPTHYYKK